MLNPVEEKKFLELNKLCRELGVPAPPDIFINLKVEKQGKVLFEDRQRGHSWNRNFYNTLLSHVSDMVGTSTTWGASHVNAKDITGTVRGGTANNVNRASAVLTTNGFHGSTTTVAGGIVVGTSDTAFSGDHHHLQAPIAAGTGAGQLAYQEHQTPAGTYDATPDAEKWTVRLSRAMLNNSLGEGDIVVNETGLIWRGQAFVTAVYSLLVERSVLDPAVTVPFGSLLTVTYDIGLDFSAID